MKKPWSPNSSEDPYTAVFTCLHQTEREAELIPVDGEEKQEREKKHTSFTLCNVCNIQLNSAAQAQIHYNGKSHQKRLKQLSNGNLRNDQGKMVLSFSFATVTVNFIFCLWIIQIFLKVVVVIEAPCKLK